MPNGVAVVSPVGAQGREWDLRTGTERKASETGDPCGEFQRRLNWKRGGWILWGHISKSKFSQWWECLWHIQRVINRPTWLEQTFPERRTRRPLRGQNRSNQPSGIMEMKQPHRRMAFSFSEAVTLAHSFTTQTNQFDWIEQKQHFWNQSQILRAKRRHKCVCLWCQSSVLLSFSQQTPSLPNR